MSASFQTIDPKNILLGDHALLDQLLAVSISLTQTEGSTALSREALIAVLQSLQQQIAGSELSPAGLFEAVMAELPAGTVMDLHDCRRLRVIDTIFDELPKRADIDPTIMEQLQRLRIPYGKLALIDNSLLASAKHSAHQLIDYICVCSIGWYPGLDKSGEKFLLRLRQTITSLLQDFSSDVNVLVEVQQDISEFLVKDAAQMEKIAQRRCDTEIGKVKALHVQIQATNTINQATRDCSLPACSIEFLQGHWLEILRRIQFQHGAESEDWAQARTLTKDLIFSLQAPASDRERSRQLELIPELNERLILAMQQADASGGIAEQAQGLLNAIELELVVVLKGQQPQAVAVIPLPELEAVEVVDSIESIPLLGEVLKLTPGKWMHYQDENGCSARCQLARKIEGINKLLFVNSQGITVMAKSLGELASCLYTGRVKPIEARKAFSSAYRSLLKLLVKRYEVKSST